MNQEEKQTVVCIFGAKVLVERMSHNDFLIDGGDEVKERFARAAQELDDCCRMIMLAIGPEQRKEVERVVKAYKLAMVPMYDPIATKKRYMVDDADMKVIIRNLFEDCCHGCTKDKTAVKYCELRRALNNAGEDGIDGGLGLSPFEYS